LLRIKLIPPGPSIKTLQDKQNWRIKKLKLLTSKLGLGCGQLGPYDSISDHKRERGWKYIYGHENTLYMCHCELWQVFLCSCTVRNVLYCTVLYCTVLYCTVLYCTVLYELYYISEMLLNDYAILVIKIRDNFDIQKNKHTLKQFKILKYMAFFYNNWHYTSNYSFLISINQHLGSYKMESYGPQQLGKISFVQAGC